MATQHTKDEEGLSSDSSICLGLQRLWFSSCLCNSPQFINWCKTYTGYIAMIKGVIQFDPVRIKSVV